MDRLIALGQLMDYYGSFLTERQQSLVRQYAYEDLSLGEIAEREGISRQGVRDGIVHAEKQMREIDARLGLIEKSATTAAAADALQETLQGAALTAEEREQVRSQLGLLRKIWEDEDGV